MTEIAAQEPGIGIILIPKARAFLTSLKPGSEIKGVPASDIKAIFSPF